MEREKAAIEIAWQSAETARFWGHIACGEHILQVYESETDLLNTLFDFASDGFQENESVVMIATPEHLDKLEDRLRDAGHNLFSLKLQQLYIPINASVVLAEFMLIGTPDPILFNLAISNLVKRAKRNQRPVRAFAEMVSLLWTEENPDAALKVADLWNDYMRNEPLTLLCGYPASIATNSPERFAEVHQKYRRCLCGQQSGQQQVLFRSL